MNFISRTSLGNLFVEKLSNLKNKDAIIICLDKSSLHTCITVAAKLHAWVYPLLYVPVINSKNEMIGVFDQNGAFLSIAEVSRMKSLKEATQYIVDSPTKAQSLKAIETSKLQYGILFDTSIFNSRELVVMSDLLQERLPVYVLSNLLNNCQPQHITACVGNISSNVVDILRATADTVYIKDIVSGVSFNDYGYFDDNSDTANPTSLPEIVRNISAYWK